jgi:hypothetical protein
MTEPNPPVALPYSSGNYFYDRDANHLNLLAVFHYVFGGIVIVFSSLFIIHIVLGVMMIRGEFANTGSSNPPPPEMGWVFVGFGSLAVLIGWASGILAIFSGRCIRSRRHWLFSLIMAGLLCLNIPLGTVLGVFTFIVLLRESVKTVYGLPPANAYRTVP